METSKSQEAVDRIERTDPSKGNGPRETTGAEASVAAEGAGREAGAGIEDAQPIPPANRDAPYVHMRLVPEGTSKDRTRPT